MKSTFLRPAMALALALGLGACGGSATYHVAGTISGLRYAGLVLANGGAELAVPANSTTFSFPNAIDYGTPYALSVKANPAHQTCSVHGTLGSDTAGRMATINIPVNCVMNAFSLGGKITGLRAEGLILTNGSTGGTVTVAKDATTFTFANTVDYGVSYGVTVLKQPAGQTCTVSNGVGEMGDAKVENVQVTCTTSIGG